MSQTHTVTPSQCLWLIKCSINSNIDVPKYMHNMPNNGKLLLVCSNHNCACYWHMSVHILVSIPTKTCKIKPIVFFLLTIHVACICLSSHELDYRITCYHKGCQSKIYFHKCVLNFMHDMTQIIMCNKSHDNIWQDKCHTWQDSAFTHAFWSTPSQAVDNQDIRENDLCSLIASSKTLVASYKAWTSPSQNSSSSSDLFSFTLIFSRSVPELAWRLPFTVTPSSEEANGNKCNPLLGLEKTE